MSKIVKLRRIETFSAAHRLHNSELTDEENLKLFGKCNTLHGHNYKVEVEVRGAIDIRTGMVINLTDLKRMIGDVLMQLDHQNLNEIAYFKQASNRPTSAENIVCFIFDRLNELIKQFNQDLKLNSITLHETDKNIVKYKG